MARSELFRKLGAALRSPTQCVGPIDRRTFLYTSLTASAVVAGALYPGTKSLFAKMPREKETGSVAVIGAGLAGLTAAYRLAKQGVSVSVFEAGTRSGGRVLTKKDFHAGMFCEMGGELIDRNHSSLLGLARDLGVEIEGFPGEADDISETLYFSGGQIYRDSDLNEAARPLVKIIRRDREKIFGNVEGETLDFRTAGKYPNSKAFDQQSLAEYFENLRGVDGWFKRLVGHAYVTEFGLELHEQSALNIHLLIDFDLSDGEFSLFGDSDESLRVKGGNSELIEKLTAAVVGNIGEIQYGNRLVSMEDTGTKVRLQFLDPNGSTREFIADRVVCAMPFSLLRSVEIRTPLSAPNALAVRRMAYGSHAKSILGTRDRFWRKSHVGIPAFNGSWVNDLSSQAYWETSRGQLGSAGILSSFRGGAAGMKPLEWSSDHTLDTVVGGFLKPFAREDRARLGRTMLEAKASIEWASSPFSLGSYFCPRPGDTTTLIGAAETPEWGGRLVFAGEHTSSNYGYMDAAVESGIKAVERLPR